jgi:hypothetical protein
MDGAVMVDFQSCAIRGCANFFMLGGLRAELDKNLIEQVEGH